MRLQFLCIIAGFKGQQNGAQKDVQAVGKTWAAICGSRMGNWSPETGKLKEDMETREALSAEILGSSSSCTDLSLKYHLTDIQNCLVANVTYFMKI